MSTTKRKPTKAKKAGIRVKDLRPAKDARGGAQKKEGPGFSGKGGGSRVGVTFNNS